MTPSISNYKTRNRYNYTNCEVNAVCEFGQYKLYCNWKTFLQRFYKKCNLKTSSRPFSICKAGLVIMLDHWTWPNVFITWSVIMFPNFEFCLVFSKEIVENYLPRNEANNNVGALFSSGNASLVTWWKPGHW